MEVVRTRPDPIFRPRPRSSRANPSSSGWSASSISKKSFLGEWTVAASPPGATPWVCPSGAGLAREEVLRLVAKNLKVSTEANTRLVEILYDSTDPQLAADFVNALTTEFIQQNLESHVGRPRSKRASGSPAKWKTSGSSSRNPKMSLQSYAHASGLLFTSEKVGSQLIEGNVAEEKAPPASGGTLQGARRSRHQAIGVRVGVHSAPESLPEVLDDKTLEDYQVKLTDLRRQLAELSSSLTPAHPCSEKGPSPGNNSGVGPREGTHQRRPAHPERI
jgi:uncharacterized protein involved in exopolysaccharide biosynthesis